MSRLEDQLDAMTTKCANTEAQLDIARWQSHSQAQQAVAIESDLVIATDNYKRLQTQLEATTQCLTEMTDEFAEYRNQQLNKQEDRFENDDDESEDEYVSHNHHYDIEDEVVTSTSVDDRVRQIEQSGWKKETKITNITNKERLSPKREETNSRLDSRQPVVNTHRTEDFIKHKIEEIHHVDDGFDMVDEHPMNDDSDDEVAKTNMQFKSNVRDESALLATLIHKTKSNKQEQRENRGKHSDTARTNEETHESIEPVTEADNSDRRAALREAWMNLASS